MIYKIIGIILALIIIFLMIQSYLFNSIFKTEVKKLKQSTDKSISKKFDYSQIKHLPEPVQRYLKYSIKEGTKYISSVELRQTGSFRTKPEQSFFPLKAEQYFTTRQPGFVWKGKMNMLPIFWVEARDKYYQGQGNTLIKLLSAITVGNSKGKDIDVSSLIRYVGEMPWFPTAMLSDNVKWSSIDSNSAKITVTDKGNVVCAEVTFNEKGQVVKFHTTRPMNDNGKSVDMPFTGVYSNYKQFDGVIIPTKAETIWNMPDGDFKWGIFKIQNIKYNTF